MYTFPVDSNGKRGAVRANPDGTTFHFGITKPM
jgi:hypothetical protein